MEKTTYTWLWFALVFGLHACQQNNQPQQSALVQPNPLNLKQAAQQVLNIYKKANAFRLVNTSDVTIGGQPAVRFEAQWEIENEKRQGIIHIIENPKLFNVISFSAPLDNKLHQTGLAVYQQILSSIKPASCERPLSVQTQGKKRILCSRDLKLQITYPKDWIHTIEDQDHALVLSGKRSQPTWLTTIAFSTIHKWPGQKKK